MPDTNTDHADNNFAERPTAQQIQAMISNTIKRQIATTRSGKALTAMPGAAELLAHLMANIEGNLALIVDSWVDGVVEGDGIELWGTK